MAGTKRANAKHALCAMLLYATAGFAWADYNLPTQPSDCHIWSDRYPFKSRLDAAQAERRSCGRGLQMWRLSNLKQSRVCWMSSSDSFSQTPSECVALDVQRCNVVDEAKEIERTCRAKLAQHQQEALARKQREEAEAKARLAQQEQQRLLAEGARRAIGQHGGLPQESKLTLAMQNALLHGGKLAATPSSAHQLSQMLLRAGSRYVHGVGVAALGELDNAMGGWQETTYGSSNPRPSQAAMQRASHLMQAGEQAQSLPTPQAFGGESLVLSAYSDVLSLIVQARAEGVISQPVAVMTSMAATVIAYLAVKEELKMRRKADNTIKRHTLNAISNQEIRRQRQASLRTVRVAMRPPEPKADSARVPAPQVARPVAPSPQPGPGGGLRILPGAQAQCIRMDRVAQRIYNQCDFRVSALIGASGSQRSTYQSIYFGIRGTTPLERAWTGFDVQEECHRGVYNYQPRQPSAGAGRASTSDYVCRAP